MNNIIRSLETDFIYLLLEFNKNNRKSIKATSEYYRTYSSKKGIEVEFQMSKKTLGKSKIRLSAIEIIKRLKNSGHLPSYYDCYNQFIEELMTHIKKDERSHLLHSKDEKLREFKRFYYTSAYLNKHDVNNFIENYLSFVCDYSNYLDYAKQYDYIYDKELNYNSTTIEKSFTYKQLSNEIKVVGREEELCDLHDLIASTDRVITISGMGGGIGKTEICKKYLRRYKYFYRRIGWMKYEGSLKQTMVNNIVR